MLFKSKYADEKKIGSYRKGKKLKATDVEASFYFILFYLFIIYILLYLFYLFFLFIYLFIFVREV